MGCYMKTFSDFLFVLALIGCGGAFLLVAAASFFHGNIGFGMLYVVSFLASLVAIVFVIRGDLS
jgi:hypothetical protein